MTDERERDKQKEAHILLDIIRLFQNEKKEKKPNEFRQTISPKIIPSN